MLDALVAAFPRTIMSEETVRIYARFLVDIDLDTAVAAVARLIARGRGFPLIADLREMSEMISGHGPPDTDQAFAEVMRAVSKWGAYGEPKWTHSAIRQAVESITWREVCFSEHAPSLRKHFQSAYESAKKRTTDPAHAALVAGVVSEVKQRLIGAAASAKQLDKGKP